MGFIAPLLGLESKQSSEESESKTQKAKNQEEKSRRMIEKDGKIFITIKNYGQG